MSAFLRVYKGDDSPLYIQAADALRARILDGEFRPGDKLPSVRKLSDELGVNPATIVSAYRILTNEGLVEARAGSGAYVAPSPALGEAPGLFPGESSLRDFGLSSGKGASLDLSASAPPRDLYPLEELKRFIVEAIDAEGGAAFDYQDPAGYAPLRRSIALRLSSEQGRARSADPEDVHIVSGAQQGVDLAARVLLRRGDVAVLEAPGYRGALDSFVAAGARVEALDVLEGGMDLGQLERIAATKALRLVHVNPSLQNPTGITYGLPERKALVAMAERYGFYIIEDDLFADLLGEDALPTLRSLDSADRVVLVKSYSKTLMPGLRIASMEAPRALRSRIEEAKRSVDLSSNGLMQRALERFLSSGAYDSHLVRSRERYARAYESFSAEIARKNQGILSWERPLGGINIWIALPAGLGSREYAARCERLGCLVSPEDSFRFGAARDARPCSHVRASIGSIPLADMPAAAELLAAAAL